MYGTMSRSPDEEKRKRILQVAYEAFGDLGYRRTTIKHIAERAKIAPGTVYTYFQDKDELFLSAISEMWDVFAAAAKKAAENQQMSFPLRCRELFSVAADLIRKSHKLLSGIFALPARRDMLRKNLEKACRNLVPFFEEGRQKGFRLVDTSPEYAFYQIKILISGVLWDLALVDGPAFETALKQLEDAFFKEVSYYQS